MHDFEEQLGLLQNIWGNLLAWPVSFDHSKGWDAHFCGPGLTLAQHRVALGLLRVVYSVHILIPTSEPCFYFLDMVQLFSLSPSHRIVVKRN